jgi:predicted RNA-binding Zn ribbon-like protein
LEKELQERYAKFERFDLNGGHPVLDFTNTVDWRGTGRDHDWLGDFSDLLAWCHRTAFLPEPAIAELARRAAAHPRQAAAALQQALELREAAAALLRAALGGRSPAAEPLGVFNRYLGKALSHAVLQPGTGSERNYRLELVTGDAPLEDVTLRLARQAADLLTAFDPSRLKVCGNPECGWMFLDNTRNASRRWCDMAACGNRAKAKRYYSKKRLNATQKLAR